MAPQISLTWRYDFVTSHSSYMANIARTTPQGSPVRVSLPSEIPAFHPTLAMYPIVSLIFTLTALTGTYLISPALGDVLASNCGIVLTIPVVIGSTAFGAWRKGQLKEWWMYTET